MSLYKISYELFFKFLLKNLKLVIVIFTFPQIILFIYGDFNKNKMCLASTKIIISKAVSNTKIVDEIFIQNLNLDSYNNVSIAGRNIIIEGENNKECKDTYKVLLNQTSVANSYIEEFYRAQLTDEERSRFAGPILFNSIGRTKIQFAKLSPLDLEKLKNKRKTYMRVYILIASVLLIIISFFLSNLKKLKNYL